MRCYDLAVVGGGILGTFYAYHALRMGLKVLILEKDSFPVGATVRNFGQIVPSGLSDRWFDYGVRSLEIYKDLQQNFDLSVRQNGTVYIASDPDECLLIHELKNHYDHLGYMSQLYSRRQLQHLYPSIKASYGKEAIAFTQEISIAPREAIYRLHGYLREQFTGCKISYNSPVIHCSQKFNRVYLKTTYGDEICAEKAIICSGHECKLLYPQHLAASGMVVSKLQMLRTSPMPWIPFRGNILTGLSIRRYESFETHCPSFSLIKTPDHYTLLKSYGIHILFKQADDGSIIIGDSHQYAPAEAVEILNFSIDQKINNCIVQEAKRIANIDLDQIDTSWVGFYAQHNTDHIFEKDVESNIHIRTGIGGKGMTASAGYTEQSLKNIYG